MHEMVKELKSLNFISILCLFTDCSTFQVFPWDIMLILDVSLWHFALLLLLLWMCVCYQMSKYYSEINQERHTSTPTAVCTQSTAALQTHLMLKAPPTLSLCRPDGVLVQHKPHMNQTRKTHCFLCLAGERCLWKKHNVFITSHKF